MTTTKEIGDRGEHRALNYLLAKGYLILVTNFRYKRGEVDIIAEKNNILFFVEVKYRKSSYFGFPEEFVDEKKLRMLRSVAESYINRVDWKGDIQFDVIAIQGNDLKHFKDVLS